MTRKPRILCIEDNPVNWRLARRLLEQTGCEMHWAEEGFKGFDMAVELKPDLILLDINLPGLSGFEIATKFRQTPEISTIPIVALTAKTQKIDRETALVAGCDGFIPKPIDPFTFAKQVEAYLGGLREKVDEAREGEVLRGFNVQMLEHLEIQLKEAQEANRKLVTAQRELEHRSQSLSRLLGMSKLLLSEHNPQTLLINVLEHACSEMGTKQLSAYRIHSSEGYWEGFQRNGEVFETAPTLPQRHPFCEKLSALPGSGVLHGELLRLNRIWEEGQTLGFWDPNKEAALLPLRAPKDEREIRGFWIFSRDIQHPFQPLELEIMTLHASMAMVGLENAELIVDLHESTRALASSYERIEGAYQDLQTAKAELNKQERQNVMEDLFRKITQRLDAPVQQVSNQISELDRVAGDISPKDTEGAQAIRDVKKSIIKIGGLLKGLMRRIDKESGVPEWLDLNDLLMQELELIRAEGILPNDAKLDREFTAENPKLFGVYGDFSRLLTLLATHAFSGPTPSNHMQVRTWQEPDMFHAEILDEGGTIPENMLKDAWEPFKDLHQQSIEGIRSTTSLPHCKQILDSYNGVINIRNKGNGTAVHFSIPL